jgi:hypothetical protein
MYSWAYNIAMLKADEGSAAGGVAGSARARAVRRAQAAAAAGAAERVIRQQRIEAALADYFEAAAMAGRIRETARARAAKVMAAAEQAAAVHDIAACAAIAALRSLGQVNARIAGMCGISVATVRTMAASGRARAPGGLARREGPGQEGRPVDEVRC